MPGQVIPIQDIASAGVIMDTPSIALPPNALSNVQNMRFHDNAARKMEGEEQIFMLSNLAYVAYWNAPSGDYYIVARTTGEIRAIAVDDMGLGVDIVLGNMSVAGGTPEWQHTIFNGGFHLVINNGLGVPMYASDPVTANSLAPLPNWESYLSQEEVVTVEWDAPDATLGGSIINLGQLVNFTTHRIIMTIQPRDTSQGIVIGRSDGIVADANGLITTGTSTDGLITVDNETGTNFIELTPRTRTTALTGAAIGDTLVISIQRVNDITVTAGVVRAYGNLLVAGDLVERDSTDSTIVRRIPGTIRTSDVAAPGTIPRNWNPFRIGVNTADEFLLASTGRIQDMVELQGVLYVYTDSSIHSVQATGNQAIPFQIATVTDSWGLDNTGGVLEVDGKHIVIGSDDVYVFAGHPGSISSIADARVRRRPFFNTAGQNVQVTRFQKYDELWFWAAGVTEMYIWNYRDNTWTRRVMTAPVSGNIGHDGLTFATATQLYTVDDTFSLVDSTSYESFIERRRMSMAPEFDTETLSSVSLLYTGTATLTLDFVGTSRPGDLTSTFISTDFRFDETREWKVDARIQGRFLNYRISDGVPNSNQPWNLTGMQFDIAKGGTR